MPGCRLPAVAAAAPAPSRAVLGGFFLELEDRALGEEVGAQVLVEPGSWRRSHSSVMAACSFSSSRLWARTCGQLGVVGGIDALVVPVDGLQLLHDRADRPVAIDGGRRQAIRWSSCRILARMHQRAPRVRGRGVPEGVPSRRPRGSSARSCPPEGDCQRPGIASVADPPQAQAVGRSELGRRLAVARPEDVAIRPRPGAAAAHIDQRADDRAHHLVAEGVGLDVEPQHPVAEVVPAGVDAPGARAARRLRRPWAGGRTTGSRARRSAGRSPAPWREVERGGHVPGGAGQERVGDARLRTV